MRFVGVFALVLLTAGCGNLVGDVEQVGRLGVTVDEAGKPVVLVEPCREGTARIDVSLGRSPGMDSEQKNEEVGSWTAAAASDKPSELEVTAPGDAWKGPKVEPPQKTTHWILTGTFDGEDETSLAGLDFTGADLAALDTDTVLVGGSGEGGADQLPRTDFDGDC